MLIWGDTILSTPLDTIGPMVEAQHSLLQFALEKTVHQITKMQMHNVTIDSQQTWPCMSLSMVHDNIALHIKNIRVQILYSSLLVINQSWTGVHVHFPSRKVILLPAEKMHFFTALLECSKKAMLIPAFPSPLNATAWTPFLNQTFLLVKLAHPKHIPPLR